MINKNTLDPRALLEGTTPGPWEYVPIDRHGERICDTVKTLSGDEVVYDVNEEADARLIAAAPQLAQSNIAMSERIAELRRVTAKLVKAVLEDQPADASDEWLYDELGSQVGTAVVEARTALSQGEAR